MRILTMKKILLIFSLVLSTILTGSVNAKESQLAGIRLGMSREQVIDLLKSPAGRMYSEPAMEIRSPEITTGAGFAPPTAPVIGKKQALPNTMVFVDMLTGSELVISETTIVKQGASMMSYGMMPDGSAESVTLPAWGYIVRANSLALDQEMLIFRINSTTSIGVTITKNKSLGTSRVTNIVACSYDPLRTKAKSVPVVNRPKIVDTSTSTNVKIGSSLTEVMNSYRWSPYIYPFVAAKVDEIAVKAPPKQDSAVPITVMRITRTSENTDSVSPETSLWETTEITPVGDKSLIFTDGVKTRIGMGFSQNLLILYPDDGVAFTIINMKVVRIQVGDSVIIPPDPPKPEIPVYTPPDGNYPPGNNPPGGNPPIWN